MRSSRALSFAIVFGGGRLSARAVKCVRRTERVRGDEDALNAAALAHSVAHTKIRNPFQTFR